MQHINLFQPSAAFHIENSHFIYTANHMAGFYMKDNTGLKSVNPVFLLVTLNL